MIGYEHHLAHGGAMVLLDQAIKVALLVGWVIASGLAGLVLAGIVGVLLRNLLGLRWLLALLLPPLNVLVLVLLLRAFTNDKSLVPDVVLALFGVPVVAMVALAVAVLIALPSPIAVTASTGSFDDELLRPRESNRGKVALVREGMAAPLAGWHVMRRHPSLWRFAVIPVVLNLLITLVILVALVSLAVLFAVKLHPMFDPTWTDRLMEGLVVLLLVVVALGATLAAWILLNGMLCGYYYGKLAREAEIRLGMPPEQMKEITVRAQAVDTLRDLLAAIKLNLGVLALNLLPGIGTIIAFPVGAYVNGVMLGKDFMDFPLSLRGLRREEKWPIVRAHKFETFGLGLAVFLFQLIPILGAVVAATAVVGAVVLNRRWSSSPPPPSGN